MVEAVFKEGGWMKEVLAKEEEELGEEAEAKEEEELGEGVMCSATSYGGGIASRRRRFFVVKVEPRLGNQMSN